MGAGGGVEWDEEEEETEGRRRKKGKRMALYFLASLNVTACTWQKAENKTGQAGRKKKKADGRQQLRKAQK